MKLIIAGGGTGGHVFPAVCIAEEFIRSVSDSDVVFVGAVSGIENRIIPELGFRLLSLNVGGLRGKKIVERLRNIKDAFIAVKNSFSILQKEKPDAVLGVGGYASGPLILSARIMKYPTAIHEQNSIPGLTNKILGKFVDRVFLSFEEAGKFFKKEKAVFSGMPVRKSVIGTDSIENKNNKFTVLVIGGSQGARGLNRVFAEMTKSNWMRDNLKIIHQTGQHDFNEIKQLYHNEKIDAEVFDFIKNMGWAYSVANLVIARAGASTLAELSATCKPSILIPYPYAAGDHQRMNADAFVKAGAAEVILEKELTPAFLEKRIKALADAPGMLEKMSRGARSLYKRDAANKIVEGIIGLIKDRGKIVV